MAALAGPALTGLPRADLAALTADLELPWAAAREQRLHQPAAAPAGPAPAPPARSNTPWKRLLPATIYHHRHGMPYSNIAALLGADHTTIGPAIRVITDLLGAGHPALAAGPDFLYTPDDLRRHAATAGITIPDPPPHAKASAHSRPWHNDTPETQVILECLHMAVMSQTGDQRTDAT